MEHDADGLFKTPLRSKASSAVTHRESGAAIPKGYFLRAHDAANHVNQKKVATSARKNPGSPTKIFACAMLGKTIV